VSAAFAGVAGLVVLAGLAGGAAACGNSEDRCDTSLSACPNSASFRRNVPLTSTELSTLQIQFCRNTDCWTLSTVAQDDGSYVCTSVPDGATCGITQDETSGYIVSVSTTGNLDVPDSDTSDQFSVTITATDLTAPVYTLSKDEDWVPQYTNGTDCPAACKTAVLE
jgi:hypothetical protein